MRLAIPTGLHLGAIGTDAAVTPECLAATLANQLCGGQSGQFIGCGIGTHNPHLLIVDSDHFIHRIKSAFPLLAGTLGFFLSAMAILQDRPLA